MRDFGPAYDRSGSWLCENSSARRARRNISKKLRIMESNDAARAMFDTFLENCNFYISPMYEFLHSQGHPRPSRAKPHHPASSPRKRPFGRHHGIIFWLISRAVEVPIFCLSDLNQSTAQATNRSGAIPPAVEPEHGMVKFGGALHRQSEL